jgi:excisionase family DNA binding protein
VGDEKRPIFPTVPHDQVIKPITKEMPMRKIIRDSHELGQRLPENDYHHYGFVWTVDDAARELKCSKRHIFKLVSNDLIPYAKVGRLVRFSPIKVGEWIRKGGMR